MSIEDRGDMEIAGQPRRTSEDKIDIYKFKQFRDLCCTQEFADALRAMQFTLDLTAIDNLWLDLVKLQFGIEFEKPFAVKISTEKEHEMSWSVSASGSPEEVKKELERQFNYPLATKPGGLSDEGERITVQNVSAMINQALDTFGPERAVIVSASGHMGFTDWEAKTGAYQNVTVNITPKT